MNVENEIIELKKRIEALEDLLNIQYNKKNSNENVVKENATSFRDKTKYIFEGKILPKNRLVFAIVKKFIDCHNPDYNTLKTSFDKSLQGSLGVVMLLSNAKNISDGPKRFFMKDDEILTLKDNSKVVVCTQWGAFNIKNFIKQAENLGFVIDKV